MANMTFRRKARELALQILFQREFLGDVPVEPSLAYFQRTLSEPDEVWSFCRVLVEGVVQHQEALNQAIAGASSHWSLARMATVDLILMRLATFEVLFAVEPTPKQVVLDEAVEIARKYSTTESGAFVNGVLDQLFKSKV